MTATNIFRRRILTSCAVLALAALGPTVFAQRAPLQVLSVPERAGQPINLSKELLVRERQAVASGQARNVNVIVRLEGEPLASYRGTVPGLAATAPKAI